MATSPHSKALAAALAAGVVVAGGTMKYAQKETKATQGNQSMYNEPTDTPGGDSRLNSSEVAAEVSKPIVGKGSKS